MNILGRLKEKITEYIDVHVKLLKLNLVSASANLMSYFIFLLIGLFIFFCILLFIGFGLTEVFVMAGFTKMAGFFLTIGVYLLLLVLLVALRKPITRFFASGAIAVLTSGDNEDDDDEDNDRDKEDKN